MDSFKRQLVLSNFQQIMKHFQDQVNDILDIMYVMEARNIEDVKKYLKQLNYSDAVIAEAFKQYHNVSQSFA